MVDLKKVRQVLRHRQPATTGIYVEGNYSGTSKAIRLLEVRNLENIS
jgi:hypothetical protein